ncbi:hypothetical protein RHSIM_Rhsim05G0043600 [Rhododendron simsii]|uniref:Elongation factor Ts, mitochondrial n=1 Tax=Rhododendron simsii TaxID=118357 RepID=A0A834LMP2_RHOSS|nr:hypothetical protein RHSIM_Rhsim05G0043600 [Rhododendron simsii]
MILHVPTISTFDTLWDIKSFHAKRERGKDFNAIGRVGVWLDRLVNKKHAYSVFHYHNQNRSCCLNSFVTRKLCNNIKSSIRRSEIRKTPYPPLANHFLHLPADFIFSWRLVKPIGLVKDIFKKTESLKFEPRMEDNCVLVLCNITKIGCQLPKRLFVGVKADRRISSKQACGTDLAIEEADSPIADEDSGAASEIPTDAVGTSEESPELVPGATFNGKVMSIQPFGAFVDFGAFTDGLTPQDEHAKELVGIMDSGSSVEIGEEVNVRVLRISGGRVILTKKPGREKEGKFDQTGTMEVNVLASTSLEELNRKSGDGSAFEIQADDTVAKDEDNCAVFPKMTFESFCIVVTCLDGVGFIEGWIGLGRTSRHFIFAFEIENYMLIDGLKVSDEAEKEINNLKAQNELKVETPGAESEIASATLIKDEKVVSVPDKYGTVTNSNGQNGASSAKESTAAAAAISPILVKQLRDETGAGMMDCKKALSESGGDLVKAQEFLRKKGLASADKKASRATAEGKIGAYIHDSRIGVLIEVNCETDFVSRGEIFKELVDDLAMQVAACPQVQYLATDDVPKEAVEKEREIEMQKEDLLSKPEQIRSRIVDGRIKKRLDDLALLEQPYIKNDKLVVKDWVKQTIATIGENIKVKRFVRFNLGEGLEKKSQDFAAEVAAQTAPKSVVAPSPGQKQPDVVEAVDKPQKATVSAALVKQLREETGAGMMDCKKALSETEGDLGKAQEYLRKKGLSTADKKSSRLAAEGRIGSYIHDSRIGVLIEVNCETDFVGRGEKFKELVDDLAMQVVACPQVQYVSIEDIPESIVIKEKELEMQREDLQSKPENIRERIVEGRISKRLGEVALLEQPFIKNDSILVKDLVKQTVAALGENIKVRRFVRFTLGDTKETAETENKA